MNATPKYHTGELVMLGDRVWIDKKSYLVEIVSVKGSPDFQEWMDEGVMLVAADGDRMATKFDDEDLIFVGRRKNENDAA